MYRLLLLLALFLPRLAAAQATPSAPAEPDSTEAVVYPALSFGYLSYDQALRQMPDYAIVQQQLAQLREKYEAEARRVENEFNQKYEAFLEGQHEFPRTILLKRQTELQEMMQRNIAFREQSRQELQRAEEEALAPLRAKLSRVLATVATEHDFVLIINTDANACPYINPLLGEYIGDEVKAHLETMTEP